MIVLYTTVETIEQAEHIAEILLGEHLVACANMWPIRSMYAFKEKMIKSDEVSMYLKTSKEKHDAVYKKLTEIHPYECPAIMTINVDHVHSPFLDWIKEQTHVAA